MDEQHKKTESGSSHPELDFFNNLSGTLDIELEVPGETFDNLAALYASPNARVIRLDFEAEFFIRESETFRPITPEELDSVAFRDNLIRLRRYDGDTVAHHAPNGSFFTVRDLLRAVEETERQTRDQSEWDEGVDVHHIYFEGIHPRVDGVWVIYWGS